MAKSQGYEPYIYGGDEAIDFAEGVVGLPMSNTGRAVGKSKAAIKRIEARNAAKAEYNRLVESGQIKSIETERTVDINLESESGQAMKRMAEKRMTKLAERIKSGGSLEERDINNINKAIATGVEIPESVKSAIAKKEISYTNNTRLSDADIKDYASTGGKRALKAKEKTLESGNTLILTSSEDIKKYIDDSLSGAEQNTIKGYGKVGKRFSEEVKVITNGDIDISGKYLELSSDNLKHSAKNHTNPKREGDISLSVYDYENIPEYIDNYDDILDVVQTREGLWIQLGKKVNGYSVITELAQDSRNSLNFKNMWGVSTEKYINEYKNKRIRYRAISNNADRRETSYTFSETPLNKTVSQSTPDVNTKNTADVKPPRGAVKAKSYEKRAVRELKQNIKDSFGINKYSELNDPPKVVYCSTIK